MPPSLAGDYDYSRFGTGERLKFEPYRLEEFHQVLAFAHRWQLDGNVVDREFDRLTVTLG